MHNYLNKSTSHAGDGKSFLIQSVSQEVVTRVCGCPAEFVATNHLTLDSRGCTKPA
jgi:hypothetical protein